MRRINPPEHLGSCSCQGSLITSSKLTRVTTKGLLETLKTLGLGHAAPGVGKTTKLPINHKKNIARGTTDPWVDLIASQFSQQVACICWKCSHQKAPLALVGKIWPSGGAWENWAPRWSTCISKKFGHQMAPHALSYCLGFTYWHHQLVSTSYFHQSESNQQGLQLGSSTRVIN